MSIASAADDGAPDLDSLLTVLADRRRRRVLRHLRGRGPTRVAKLAALLAAHGPTGGGDGAPAVEELRVVLHHRHLPVLVEAGLVDGADDRGRVAITERGERVGDWLDRTVDELVARSGTN